MSHYLVINTAIKDMEALKKALTRMGLTFQVGDFGITQEGRTEKAEIKVDDAVGFAKQKDGTFSMVGDFYYSKSSKLREYYYNNGQFQKDIQVAYAIEDGIQKMAEQQFRCIENEEGKVGKDGMITLTYECL